MRASLSEIRASVTSREVKAALPLLLKTVLPIGIFFLALHFAFGGEIVGRLTRDPNAVSKAPFYVGFISMLGIALWMASALMTLIGASLASHSGEDSRLLIGFGLLTVLLSLDDMLQLHELVLPGYFGIPEKVVYATYLSAALFLIARHSGTLLRNEPIIFAAALFFLGLSVLADGVPADVPLLSYFGSFAFEDGCKFAGITLWTIYFARYLLRLARGETLKMNARAGTPQPAASPGGLAPAGQLLSEAE